MSKKLTVRQIEERKIATVLKRIHTIEKDYGTRITRYACMRFADARRNEARITKEIQRREKELRDLRNRVRL